MSTQRPSALWLRLTLLICLIVAGLLAPTPSSSASAPAACSDGFVLWANNRTASDVLSIPGSGNSVTGGVRSNADVLIGGSNNTITGPLTHATGFSNGGDDNTFPAPTRLAPADPPVAYSVAAYRPGGVAAASAAATGRYTIVEGDLDLAEPRTLNGLYYVKGNAKLSASDLRGSVTIVAEGEIDVSGSLHDLRPYAGGLLLYSTKSAPGAAVIKLAGSNSVLRGVIYAPGGMVELSGSNSSISGMILGDTVKLAGSNLTVAFSLEYCAGQTPPAPADTSAYMPGEVLVKLFNPADLSAVAAANGLSPTPIGQFGARPIYRLAILDSTSPLAKAEQLRPSSGSGGDPRVQYAEPNYLAQDPESRARGSWVIGQGGSGYTGQWAPTTIRLAAAHTVTRGAGVTVAVLDTGVDRRHPALAGRLTAGFDFVDFDSDPSEVGLYQQDFGFGHGTHVAGLIALAAPEAKIMPLRVLDKGGVGNVWVLSEALLYAVERGPDGLPASGDEPQVINLSLSTTRQTRLLRDLIAEVTCDGDDDDDDDDCAAPRGGVVVVAGAGNDGNATPQYPAAEDVQGSIAVGASTPDDRRAPFSNFGSWVRLAAPGSQIVSAVPGGGYGVWSGTSMASPLTAGAAALVRAANPSLSAVEVVERLVTTGTPINGEIAARLDAAAALGILPGSQVGSTGASKLFLPAVHARPPVPASGPSPLPTPTPPPPIWGDPD